MTLGIKPKSVIVPEADIQEVIKAVKDFLERNPNRTDCGVGIFGHTCYIINASTLEEDVRKAAESATEYSKV